MSQLPKKHPLRSVAFCFDEIEDAKSLKAVEATTTLPPRKHIKTSRGVKDLKLKDDKRVKNSRQKRPLRLFLKFLGMWGSVCRRITFSWLVTWIFL